MEFMTYAPRKGLSVEQIKWAQSHDWYVWSCIDDEGRHFVLVNETGTQLLPDGTSVPYTESHQFHDYQALRAWAGY